MHDWYFVKQGQQQGPVSLEQLRNMAAEGSLTPQDLVWNSSMSDWTPAGQTSGIFSPRDETPTAASPALPTAARTEIAHGSEPLPVMDTIKRTLDLTKKYFQPLAICGLVYFAIIMVISLVQGVIQGLGSTMTQHSGGQEVAVVIIGFSLFIQLIVSVINLFLTLGVIRFCLKLLDGEKTSIQMIFGELGKLLTAIGASILCFVMVLAGLLLLIVPGIYLALRLSAVIPAIVDRNLGVMDSISYSMSLTRGNTLNIFGLWFIALVLIIAAVVLTCGIGGIFVTPIYTLGWILAYRCLQYGRQLLQEPVA